MNHEEPVMRGGALTAKNTLLLSGQNAGHRQIAADLLSVGRIAAIPTETVYGLACVLEDEAAHRVFAAKGRPPDNPFIVHIASAGTLSAVARNIPDTAWLLAERFWPGPLTLVLKKQQSVPRSVTAGLDTVAVRCPDSEITRAVIQLCGRPLAAPSANPSGRPSPVTAAHVLADMDGKIDALLDGGPCRVGLESTVLDLTEAPPRLLRPGFVTREQLEEVLGGVLLDASVLEALSGNTVPRSPGMKYRHYAPQTPLVILMGRPEAARAFLDARPGAGVVCPAAEARFFDGIPAAAYTDAGVFEALRAVDDMGLDECFARVPKAEGVGLAVRNRLFKAAGFRVIDAGGMPE